MPFNPVRVSLHPGEKKIKKYWFAVALRSDPYI